MKDGSADSAPPPWDAAECRWWREGSSSLRTVPRSRGAPAARAEQRRRARREQLVHLAHGQAHGRLEPVDARREPRLRVPVLREGHRLLVLPPRGRARAR